MHKAKGVPLPASETRLERVGFFYAVTFPVTCFALSSHMLHIMFAKAACFAKNMQTKPEQNPHNAWQKTVGNKKPQSVDWGFDLFLLLRYREITCPH